MELEGEEEVVGRLSVVLTSELVQHQESQTSMMAFVMPLFHWTSDLADERNVTKTAPQ